MFQEDESLRSYQRKRVQLHFETPPSKKAKKSHSPDFENVSWAVLCDLQQHPSAPPAINWQNFAREHNIPGSNAGQIAKDFAQNNNIDTNK